MPDVTTFALAALLVVFGSTVSGMAGFGFGIAVMPFMLLLFPAKAAVAITPVISCFGLFVQWTRVRRDADPILSRNLIVGSLVGIPLGAVVLAAISPVHLKLAVGLAVVAAVVVQLAKGRAEGPARMPDRWTSLGTGFAGGVVGATVGQPGLPPGLLMAAAHLEKRTVRGTMVTFLVVTQLATVANLFWQKVLTPPILWTGVLLMPFYLIGLAIGMRGFHLTSQAAYRRLILGVLGASAVTGVVNGITALLP